MSDAASLAARREQAKAAFLQTLAAAQRNPNGKEVVEELTRLLGNIEGLGGDGMTGEDLAQGLANLPRLSDDQGNPIIDINETQNDVTVDRPSGVTITAEEVTPIWELPSEVQEDKRAEMDRMWAELEEEEEKWKRKKDAPEPPRTKDTKAKSPASIESASGRATSPASSSPLRKIASPSTVPPSASRPEPKKRKSVKFDDSSAPRKPNGEYETSDWGDVIPATLKTRRRVVPRGTAIMKFDVVERQLGQSSKPSAPAPLVDSDDEDLDAIRDEDDRSSDGERREKGPWESSGDEEDRSFRKSRRDKALDDGATFGQSRDEGSEEDDDEDLSTLQQQVASEYYAKRDAIFKSAEESGIGLAPSNRSPPTQPGPDWDREFVPLDATLATPPPKTPPGVSRFKAERMTSGPSVPVNAFGSAIKEVVKEGKLVGGQLVAPADSDSEDGGIGEAGKKAIEQLRSRDVDEADGRDTPISPRSGPPSASQPIAKVNTAHKPTNSTASPSTSLPSQPSSILKPSTPSLLGQIVERNAPKQSELTNSPAKSAPKKQSRFAKAIRYDDANKEDAIFKSEILSPSGGMSAPSEANATTGPDFMSMVVESPSFPSPSIGSKTSDLTDYSPDKVMMKDVVEKDTGPHKNRQPVTPGQQPEQRISRFKAERM